MNGLNQTKKSLGSIQSHSKRLPYLVQKDLLSALDGFEQSVHVGQIVVDFFVHHWPALGVQYPQVVTHHPLLTLRRDFAERARVEKLSASLVLRLDTLYHLVQC